MIKLTQLDITDANKRLIKQLQGIYLSKRCIILQPCSLNYEPSRFLLRFVFKLHLDIRAKIKLCVGGLMLAVQ